MFLRSLRFLPLLLWISFAAHAAEITLSGEVLDQRERPVEGASIEIERLPSAFAEARAQLVEARPGAVSTALSDTRGRFRVAVPEPGIWRMVIRARGFVPQKLDLLPVLRPSEPLRLSLQSARMAKIKVVNEKGEPIAGARVRIASRIEDVFPVAASRFAKTDPDGMASIPAGEWEGVAALADGYLEATHKNLTKDVTVVLVRGCRRVLNVVNLRNQPAAGVVVQAGHWALGITDASGRVEITAYGAEVALRLMTPPGRRRRGFPRKSGG